MSTLSHLIGSRIRTFRKKQGMTLQELAEQISKSRATVSKYENGEIVIDIETLTHISEVLHVPLAQLAEKPQPKPVFSPRNGREPVPSSRQTACISISLMDDTTG